MTEFVTIFDASTQSYPWWWLAIPAFLVLVLAIIYMQRRRLAPHLPLFFRTWGVLLSLSMLAFVILGSACGFVGSYSTYRTAQELLRSSNMKVVEGVVENYSPQPPFDKGVESFTVSGVKFEYSGASLEPGFNQTASHGGPITGNSEYVRVHYITDQSQQNRIMQLELRK